MIYGQIPKPSLTKESWDVNLDILHGLLDKSVDPNQVSGTSTVEFFVAGLVVILVLGYLLICGCICIGKSDFVYKSFIVFILWIKCLFHFSL